MKGFILSCVGKLSYDVVIEMLKNIIKIAVIYIKIKQNLLENSYHKAIYAN